MANSCSKHCKLVMMNKHLDRSGSQRARGLNGSHLCLGIHQFFDQRPGVFRRHGDRIATATGIGKRAGKQRFDVRVGNAQFGDRRRDRQAGIQIADKGVKALKSAFDAEIGCRLFQAILDRRPVEAQHRLHDHRVGGAVVGVEVEHRPGG